MRKPKLSSLSHLIASCFFLGYTPISPGTTTSFVAMLTLFFIPDFSILTQIITLIVLFIIGAIVGENVNNITKIDDASFIVIDEWLGMWIALFLLPKNIWLYLLAFIIFRAFDISKLPPISYLEDHAPGGLGIILDDVCAGFFTFLIMQALVLFA